MKMLTGVYAKFRPLLYVVYLSFLGTMAACAGLLYLGHTPTPLLVFVCAALIFSIYILNRFSDMKEDFANDSQRALFFSQDKKLLYIGVISLVGAALILAALGKLNNYFIALITLGLLYSYNIVPYIHVKRGIDFLRLKELPVVKNILVAVLWGASIFLVPMYFFNIQFAQSHVLFILITAMSLSTLNNTVFGDILDMEGDRLANNRSLPILIGAQNTLYGLIGINVIWALVLGFLYSSAVIDLKHFAFLLVLCAYPFSYIIPFMMKNASRKALEFFTESDLLVFSVGIFVVTMIS